MKYTIEKPARFGNITHRSLDPDSIQNKGLFSWLIYKLTKKNKQKD